MPMPDAVAAPALADAEQLLAYASDPAPRFSALHSSQVLLFAADAALPAAAEAAVCEWLAALPCPSIAIGIGNSPLAQAADVCLPALTDCTALLANIARCPIAASVLVQTLRLTSQLPLAAALVLESLAYSTLQSGPEYAAWLAQHRAHTPATPADTGPAVLIARADNTLQLTLNRASRRNAMTVEMRDGLIEALQLAAADASIAAVRMNALGKCFSTGGDLSEFGSAPNPATAHIVRSLALPGRLLAALPADSTVQVHGACVGSGIEFPAFARQLVAAPDAWFQLPELQFGLIPGAGGTVSIARRIGRQRTAWMVLSGKRIDARTALAWGLVDAVEAPVHE